MFGLPKATERNCVPASDPTEEYNCFAWAVHSKDYVIWPDQLGSCSWPPGMPRDDSIQTIVNFLQQIGYTPCADPVLQQGVEKIVIYADADVPLHLARQLPDGRWASKLGPYMDVIHATPDTLGGGEYGNPVRFLSIPRGNVPPRLPDLHPGRPKLVTLTGGILIQ